MNYNSQIIKEAYHIGYDPVKAIEEYTTLEIKYAKNKIIPEQQAKDRAFKEQFTNMMEKYRK